MATNRLRAEFRAPEITMPVAAGIQGVTQGNKAYEVRAWIAALTPCQRDPSAAGCVTSATAFAPLTGTGAADPDRHTLFRHME
jgi:hypothetical protein